MGRVFRRSPKVIAFALPLLAIECRHEDSHPHTALRANDASTPLDVARPSDASPERVAARPTDSVPNADPMLRNIVRPRFRGAYLNVPRVDRILETKPIAYRFDGDVSEWSDMPASSIPEENGSARLDFALTDTGFYVAGDVVARAEDTPLDHLRINIALQPPTLPPIAFLTPLLLSEVDEAYCRNEAKRRPALNGRDETLDESEPCLRWLAECKASRAELERRFEREINLDLVAAMVDGAPGARLAIHRREARNGVSFELELPLTSMPETSEMPLRTVRVAARLFSVARPTDQSHRGMPPPSSAPVWTVHVRKKPLRLHAVAPIVEHVLSDTSASGATFNLVRVAASYVPAPTSKRVSYFFNVGTSGLWHWDHPSPIAADIDVSKGRVLFTLHGCAPDAGTSEMGTPCVDGRDITISAYPTSFDDTLGPSHPKVSLVSRRLDSILDVSDSTAFDPYTFAVREPGVHILNVYQGPAGPYGSGPSGHAIGYKFEIMTMDREGRFSPARAFDLQVYRGNILGVDAAGFGGQTGSENPRLWIGNSIDVFGLTGTLWREEKADGSGELALSEYRFKAGFRWNPAKKDYIQTQSVEPMPDGGD